MERTQGVDILLVEDDPGDVELTREVMGDVQIPIVLHVVEDGEKALCFLKNEAPYSHAPRPDMILLDLNMPRKNGRETLREIKSDLFLRSIPVIVLTTSEAEGDIAACYDLGANCYIAKPISFDAFARVVGVMVEFWFSMVKLPPKPAE